MADPPVRLLDFVSEHELAEIRDKRTERGEVETTAPDRPLFEILKENKDKQQTEFNERFKHRPPKALDEDETEFLEKLEMHKKEQERQIAKEEALQLLNFQAAVATSTIKTEKSNLSFQQPKEERALHREKRPAASKPLINIVTIKSQSKKAKLDEKTSLGSQQTSNSTHIDQGGLEKEKERNVSAGQAKGLVMYEMESDEEDD